MGGAMIGHPWRLYPDARPSHGRAVLRVNAPVTVAAAAAAVAVAAFMMSGGHVWWAAAPCSLLGYLDGTTMGCAC